MKIGNFFKLPNGVYYLLGTDDQGFNITTIFVCDYYHSLFTMISNNDNVRRWRITGNLGIGKTFFDFYLLYLLAKKNKTVVYHKLNKLPILFSKDNIYTHSVDNIHAFKNYLGNKDIWYIVDSKELVEYVAKTILVCLL
jgi:hypothetical protein